jgi:hypothetical protein
MILLDPIVEDHLYRLRTTVLKKHGAATVGPWIKENTKSGFQDYSFKDHEYQERYLGDTSQEVVVQKCSQVGLSEASARMALALVNVITPYTIAYTLPTAKFAGTFMGTRIDPVIDGSPVLKSNLTTDNTEYKRFGDSFLYLKGAASSNAPISIPCDHLIHDEVDFSDQEVLGQYISRLTHSKWRRIHKLSTPTLPDYGINKAFKESRRHFNMCRCNHCNHWFVPDYYSHVKIPRFNGELHEITKALLTRVMWREAVVRCPKCANVPSLQPEYREWVCENASENHRAAGIQVTPFDAPNIVTASYLVEASTKYDRSQDFVNFALGLPAEDKEATLTREDFAGRFQNLEVGSGVVYVVGVDVGNTYHFVVAAIWPSGDMVIVLAEQVVMGNARKRYAEILRRWRPVCTVMDSAPHAETVMALQELDPNMYASVYIKSKSLLTHRVVDQEAEDEKGKDFVRQVNVNRSRALDAYMEFLRGDRLMIASTPMEEEIITHHVSMKRVKTYDGDSGDLTYGWVKTDGNDHFHHAFLYCFIAGKIKGVGRQSIVIPNMTMCKISTARKVT